MSGISSSHGYEGQLVSKSHNVGFVVLSCLISFIGAASTLELINRRTGLRGWFNNLLLISSAVAMGGVGIWSMHFVANRAMELANGEPAMQISYSVGFTVLSFFVPIVVLLAAFVAIGSNERLSWWRISIGGIFCGGAVCGMHYLGNASIANYQCVYAKANVAGSAILAVAASTAALSMFFVFRATWANSWWKRILSAVILAGSVCGMHWCAALGTSYMLVSPKAKDTDASRNAPVIAVICLSIGACILMAGSAILKARSMSKSAQKAQQITLAAAVFDKQGRILVDTNGLMPSMVITNAFLEKNSQDGFSVSHPLFHWMLQASRNWAPVSSLIAGMKAHLEQVPKFGSGKNIRLGVDLVSTHGELMDNYAVIFRELFCVAASALAEALGEQLTSAGVLWDDILRTGVTHREHDLQWLSSADNRPLNDPEPNKDGKWPNVTEKSSFQSQMEYGRGSLMFLVRRVRTDRDTNRLASAGYRFAEVPQVSGLIKEGMQIQSSGIESRLREMAAYSNQPTEPQPGVCLGFFGIKARVDKAGFDILVQRQTRHLLPSTSLQLDMLKPWHIDFLRQFEGKCVAYVLDTLTVLGSSNSAPDECAFARQFSLSLRDLRAGIQDPLFDQAVISTTPVSIPSLDHRGVEVLTKLVAFRLLIPVHCVISSPSCELVPLNLFKVLQVSQKQQLYFTQSLHREFGPIVGGISENSVGHGGRERLRWSTLWGAAPSAPAHAKDDVLETREELSSTKSERRCSSCASLHTDSTAGLCKTGSVRCSEIDHDDTITTTQPFSGILVSQEITVHDGSDDELDSENRGTSRRFGASARGLAARAKFGIGIQKQSPTDIEMGPLEHDSRETDTRIGQAHIVGGHDKDLASLQTFVDVLFEQCISHESKL